MKKTILRSCLSVLLILTVAASWMLLTGCRQNPSLDTATLKEEIEMGDGAARIEMTVVTRENMATRYILHTDEADLRMALSSFGIIPAGERGDLVLTVAGQTADYSVDAGYWCLYVEGKMANYGVDDAAIRDGGRYAFVYSYG